MLERAHRQFLKDLSLTKRLLVQYLYPPIIAPKSIKPNIFGKQEIKGQTRQIRE